MITKLLIALTVATPSALARLLDDDRQAVRCERKMLQGHVNGIRTFHEERDLTSSLTQLIVRFKTCDLDPQEFGAGFAELESWKAVSAENATARRQEAFENSLLFHPPDPAAFADYRDTAARMGVSEDVLNAYLKPALETSRGAEARERALCGGPTLDMSAKLGPNRDQGGIGYCASFAAADLLSFRAGFRVSAADVAYTFYDEFRNNVFKKFGLEQLWDEEGADDVAGPLQAALNRGICPEAKVASDKGENWDLIDLLMSLEELKTGTRAPGCEDKMCTKACAIRNARIFFPGLPVDDLVDVIQRSSKEVVLRDAANAACGERVRLQPRPEVVLKKVSDTDKAPLFTEIDAQLSSGNIVGIGIGAAALRNSDSMLRSQTHAVSVVGRRFNERTSECEYLIRNSYGEDANFSADFESVGGNAWVPKRNLWRSINDVTYLK